MADTDGDDTPIEYTSAYRTARRNVLFWAATTVLVAISTAGLTEPLGLAVVSEAQLPPSLLNLASLATFVFMFLAYYRAEQHFLAKYSGFALSADFKTGADAIARLIDDVSNLRRASSSVQAQVSKAEAEIEVERKVFETLHADAMRSVGANQYSFDLMMEMKTLLQTYKLPDGQPLQGSDWDELSKHIMKIGDKIEKNITFLAQNHFDSTERKFRESLSSGESTIERVNEVETTALTELVGLPDLLVGFGDAIGTRDRRWFKYYERGTVWGLSAVALVFAFWRLLHAPSLSSKIQAIFG